MSVLRQRISERQARRAQNDTIIAARQRDNEIIDAELIAYRDALSVISGDVPGLAIEHLASHAKTEASTPRRGPRGPWKSVMQELARSRSSAEFDISSVEGASQAVGGAMNPNTIRSQMANYAHAGFLERVRPGWFRFTATGLNEFRNSDLVGDERHSEADASAPNSAQGSDESPTDAECITSEALLGHAAANGSRDDLYKETSQ
jgi:hypothetical protein